MAQKEVHIAHPIKAFDRAFAVVAGAKNLARLLLVRQELYGKFLERHVTTKLLPLPLREAGVVTRNHSRLIPRGVVGLAAMPL
jgi:hypothetical protein